MATPQTSLPPAPAEATAAGTRVFADIAQRWLAYLGALLCVLQVGLAALGFWGGYEDGGSEKATRAAFEAHGMNGELLGVVAVLLLVAGLVGRANKKSWMLPLVLCVLLWAVQGLLVGLAFGLNRWFGMVHALDGMAIMGLFLWLAADRRRHPLARSAIAR